MKKWCYGILLFCLLWIPTMVSANEGGIEQYYMDATILSNGDIRVKEGFSLNGTYNGFERIIRYRNPESPSFDSTKKQYGGSELHNGSGIMLNRILGIEKENLREDSLSNPVGDIFHKTYSGYGYQEYEETQSSSGVAYKIYNPSSRNKAFYLDYTLEKMAIVHEDVAELGWNIFSTELNEDIDSFVLYLHIPNNKETLRAWAHGPLNGNIELIDKETVKVTIDDLKRNTAMDVRVVFDKDILFTASKKSGVEALSKILAYEDQMAKQANQERQKARILYYGTLTLSGVWFLGLLVLIVRTYIKYDKEYKPSFIGKYYREFPDNLDPEIVGYLMNKKVSADDLSASILNLVYKKVLRVEKIQDEKGKEDYNLIYQQEYASVVSQREKIIIDWLFLTNSNKDNQVMQITMSEFKKNAKSGYSSFLGSFESWQQQTLKDAEAMNFYEENTKGKTRLILYAIVGILLAILNIKLESDLWISISLIIISIITILYGSAFTKRSVMGNESYVKWKGMKNFLNDFGNFSEKELPEIALWEKYLVYAVTLGCANKLAKTMEVKAREYYPNYTSPYYGYGYSDMLLFHHSIHVNVNNAVNTAISTRSAAQSSNSSSGGFGGGFSSGGGSFGGGGGGGRF